MAKMIPTRLAPGNNSSAEIDLFRALQMQLSSEYTVFHSLKWIVRSKTGLKQYECDFLVIHPRKGLMAIEAKTGDIRYDRSLNSFIDNAERDIGNPFHQASSAMYHFNDFLLNHCHAWEGMTFANAVALPHTLKLGHELPSDISTDAVIFQSDMEDIGRRLDFIWHIFKPNPFKTLSAAEFESIINTLLPEFHITRTLSSIIKETEQAYIRLTEDQKRFFSGISGNSKMIIYGPPGSGKSILAAESARKFAADPGRKVLYLCYNKKLANHIALTLKDVPNVKASSYYALCRDLAYRAGIPMPEPDRGPEKTEFYKDTVPEILMDATEKLNEKYDAVIVDEAQDFSSTYWLSIEALLKDKDDSRFYIFLDPHQNIYNKTEGLPYKFPSFSLTVNCRNTKAISIYLSNISGRSMLCMDGAPDGIPPEIIKVKTATEEREAVRRVLHKLVNEDKVPADGIVILGRRRLARSSFGGPCKLGNLNIVEAGSEKFPADIRYSTIHAFKGLESDVVLLTGAGSGSEHISEEEIKTLEYVGASRARTLLYIFQLI